MAGKQYPLEILIGALDQATIPLKKINQQIDALREPVGRLQKSFNSLQKEAGLFRLQRSLTEVSRAGAGVMAGLQRIGGFVLGFTASVVGAGYALERFVMSAAKTAEALKEMSDQTGISVESLQTLGFVAGQVGVSQEQFNTSISRFTKSFGELKAGTGPLFSFLKRIDPAFARVLQRTNTTEEAFRKFIDRLRMVKSEAGRVALATAVFGRGAGNMANLAKLSSSEFAKLENRMRAIGLISKEDAEQADAFRDSWSEVELGIRNLGVMIAAKFFPILKQLSKQFTDWLVANRDRIGALATQLASQLPGALEKTRDAFLAVLPYIKDFFSAVRFLSEHTVLLKIGLVALGVYIVGPFLLSLVALSKALIGLSVTMVTTPFGLFLIGLTGISIAIYEIVDNWKLLKATGMDVFNFLLEKINSVLTAVNDLFSKIPVIGKMFDASNWYGSDKPGNNIVKKGVVPDNPQTSVRDSNVTVTFENAPRGMRVERDQSSADNLNLDVGYQFTPAGAMP